MGEMELSKSIYCRLILSRWIKLYFVFIVPLSSCYLIGVAIGPCYLSKLVGDSIVFLGLPKWENVCLSLNSAANQKLLVLEWDVYMGIYIGKTFWNY